MNKVFEVLLTVLALVGLFCAFPTNTPSRTVVRAQTVIADGSDPMPICRYKRCW